MLTIFDKSFEQDIAFNDKLTYINSTHQLTTFRTHDRELQSVTAQIQVLLGAPSTRLEGLTLLKTVINQCRQDLFVSNAKNWAQSVIEVLKSSDSRVCKDLACSILNTILVNIVPIPSLCSEVSSAIFNDLIPVLLNHSLEDEGTFAAAKCLSVCMQNFPQLLGSYQKNIEDFLGVHANTLVCAEVIADCYAHLPYCNPKGGNLAFCRDAWLKQFQKMLNTLHSILNDFLFDVEDPSVRAQFSQLDENNQMNLVPSLENIYSLLMVQARIFSVIARSLAKMMCSKSKTSLNIPIAAVLHFVHRLLSVSIDDRIGRSVDELHLIFSLLPDMRCSALMMFEALILSCQNSLVQHAEFIGEIFVQSFKISREIKVIKSDDVSMESPYRQTILKVLIAWLKRLGRGGSFEILKHQELIIELLNDILPKEPKQTVTPSDSNKPSDISNQVPKEICDDSIPLFYIEALRALSTIVYVSGNSMDRYLLKTILQQVLFILNKIQYLPIIPAPYYDARCRKKLYSLLLTTVITAAPYFKQSVSASAKIFKFGLRDSSEQVSGICHKAFSYLNPVLHPVRACPEAPAMPQALQSTGPQHSNEYTQNKTVDSEHIPWAINGVQSISEEYQNLHIDNEMEGSAIQFSPTGDSSPEISNLEEECNGVEHGPQSSSHDDNESVEEEEDEESEDMEEEEIESEDMDNGLAMLSDSPSYIRDRNLSQAKPMPGEDSAVSGHEIYSNSLEPSTGYRNRASENELLHNQEYYCNERGIKQNGVYKASEEDVEQEVAEAELGIEVGEYAPTLSKKRALENSLEMSPSKKLHAGIMEQEPTEDRTQDEPPEQNAMDMIGDFVSVSPDESQS